MRVGEQTANLSGMYMNTSDVTNATFGREKLAFYTTGEAVVADGTNATTYEYKQYQDGTIKLCADKDNYLSVLFGETAKITDGKLAFAGDTYSAMTFTGGQGSTVSYNAYEDGAQPGVSIAMNQYSESTARLILSNDILDAALAAGYTKLNISAKASRDMNLVLGGTGLWAQQKKGKTEINSETYTTFTIDLATVKNNANPAVYCATSNGDGSYTRNWAEVGVSQGYDSLDSSIGGSVFFCDYYFSK